MTVPTAAEARKLVRSYRAARRSVRALLGDLFQTLMYTGMLAGLLVGFAQVGLERAAIATVPAPAAALIGWTVLLGTLMVVLGLSKIALSLGPVLVRSAAQAWLLSSPIDRRSLLWRRFAVIVVVGLAAGALVALLARLAALGATGGPLAALLLGGTAGAALGSATVLIQASANGVRRAQALLNLLLAAGVVAQVAVLVVEPAQAPPLGWLAEGPSGVVTVAVTLAVSVLTGWLAQASLARLRRVRLSAGVDLAAAVAVATTFLEPTILWGVLLVRRTRRLARVRSARLRGSRVTALVAADFVRVRRFWAGAAVWFGLLPVPYLAAAIAPAAVLPAIHLLAAFVATDRLAGGLRIICRSPAVRRLLGGSDRQLIAAHLVLPALGAVLWSAATAGAVSHLTLLVCLVSAVGSVFVVYRMASRPPLDYSSPMFDLGFGSAVPVWLILQLSRGPALLLVLVWIQTALAG